MKHKSAFLTGISLFCCFCLLIAGGKMGSWLSGSMLALGILLVEAVAFLLPTLMMIVPLGNARPLRIPLSVKRLRPSAVHFALRLGIMVSLASFLMNLAVLQLIGQDVSAINPASFQGSDIGGHTLAYVIAVALVPALVEEIYIRGAVLQVFMRYAGTGLSIVLSAVVFAMLHGSINNFAGPLLGGIVFGWLTFVYGSIWPAVIAHAANNLFYLFVLWATDTYSAFGIWRHLPSVCVLLLLLFVYLSLRSAERILLDGRVPYFARGQSSVAAIRSIFGNPASLAFIAAFVAKTVLK